MSVSAEIIENFIQDNFPGYNKKGDEINFNSPFYQDSKKRLYINLKNKVFFDQKLQTGGKFEYFVSEYLNVSYEEACKILEADYQSYGIKNLIDIRDIITNETPEITNTNNIQVIDPLDVHPIMFDENELSEDGEYALEYLNRRKINTLKLGYFPKDDKNYSGRIFIPFYENEKLVYFLARSYTGSELRYKNPTGLTSDFVFNYDNINDTVVIFEGVFDALSLDNFIGTAILSNKMKEKQAQKILSIATLKNIIIVPDKDEKTETRKLILNNLIYNYDLLNKYKKPSRKIDFYIYDIPDGYKDFNEYKVNTNNGNIFIKDCKKFNKAEIMMKIMLL